MYGKDGGQSYYIVDDHVALWDASEENQANRYGKGFIDCFYDYHRNLSPTEWLWPREKFMKYSEADFLHDLFQDGHVDVAIFQPAYLSDFYTQGFHRRVAALALYRQHPDQIVLNDAWDPRDGEAGLERLEALAEETPLKGIKLYTAEWRGDSRGWKLTDDWSYRYLAKTEQLGITNIHIHKGPTIYPLDLDAFDVTDVDAAATDFPGLNFIVEHVGLPRLEDFCWIAAQEPNVYGGLAAVMPFIHSRPRYFAHVIGELLYWLGEDRLLFGSDYAVWHPKWLVERFVDFQIPEDLQSEYGALTPGVKRKILGLNAAKLYGLTVPAEAAASASTAGATA